MGVASSITAKDQTSIVKQANPYFNAAKQGDKEIVDLLRESESEQNIEYCLESPSAEPLSFAFDALSIETKHPSLDRPSSEKNKNNK
jgi:hypothetical protein